MKASSNAELQTNAIVAWPSLSMPLGRNHSGNPDTVLEKKILTMELNKNVIGKLHLLQC